MLQKRIAKLESVVSKLPARRTKDKPYIADDWTISELFKLANTFPFYPPDLAKKYSLTNWETNHECEDLSSNELSESIINMIKRINERGDYIDKDRIASML